MSRLCRLKTASHGPDGKWAYEEILRLRAALEVARGALDNLVGMSKFFPSELHDKHHRVTEADEALAAIDAVLPRSEG